MPGQQPLDLKAAAAHLGFMGALAIIAFIIACIAVDVWVIRRLLRIWRNR